MEFIAVGHSDAQLVRSVVHQDDRGSFSRTWCAHTFAQAGIDFEPVQGNTSFSRRRGTVRGMHFQREPKADAKIVRVSRGSIHDVIVDLRESSPTRGQSWVNVLAQADGQLLYVPAGFGHGFQTLADETVVEYLMGVEYVPELYDGFRHDDPVFGITWPEPVTALSDGDTRWPPIESRLPWLIPGRGGP